MQETSKKILSIIGNRVVEHLQANDKRQFHYPLLKSIKTELRAEGLDATSITNAIYYLRRRKYITLAGRGRSTSIVLTAKGAIQFVKYCQLLISSVHKNGCQSIVIVAISEKNRATRDFLRRRLLQAGFAHEGQSIYISPLEISPNFDLLVKLFALEGELRAGVLCPR